MSRLSTLQLQILIELQSAPAKSVTELASRVDKLRPSVSRSLGLLEERALVTHDEWEWRVTQPGLAEVDRAKERLADMQTQIQRASRALSQVVSIPVIPQDILHTVSSFSSIIETIRQDSKGIERMLSAHNEAMRRAIEPLTRAQMHNATFINTALDKSLLPDFSSILQTYNLNLANAIDDSLALRKLPFPRIAEFQLAGLDTFKPLTIHFPAITEAVGLLNQELPSRMATLDRIAPSDRERATVLAPPLATAAYSRSMRLWLDEDSSAGLPEAYPLDDPHTQIHLGLATLSPDFVEKHQGAWNALRNGGPDSLRHAAVSMRELIRVVFKQLAPDQKLGDEDSTRLKARVRHFLEGSRSGAQFATHMALGVDGWFDQMNAHTHGDKKDKAALQALMIAADGVLLYILGHARTWEP